MKINNPEKRLKKFWGKVDEDHIKYICAWIKQGNILDIGCGYGTTVGYMGNNKNLYCIGMDCDNNSIAVAKKLFPAARLLIGSAEKLPFEDKMFDTLIMRDTLHHLYRAANFEIVKKEIQRVTRNESRLIFYDPNINFFLRAARKISFHRDEECDYETALHIIQSLGYKIIYKSFNTVISLPLSGGYVGINFVPDNNFIQKKIISIDRFLENIINKLNIGRYLCWRYILVSEKI